MQRLEERFALSGLTLIVHGHGEHVNGWVDHMADEIRARVPFIPTASADAQTAEYTLQLIGPTPSTINDYHFYRSSRDSSFDMIDTASGETVIKVDWSNQANDVQSNRYIGNWVTDFLLDPANDDFVSGPIHLIGFSRGAAVITDIAYNLAERGIWVDQFTLLDPHPNPYYGDHAVRIYDNVRFADNFWHPSLGAVHPGARNLEFPYYHFTGAHSNSHWDVPLWYIGTMDTEGSFNDGSYTVQPGTSWYDGQFGPRDQIGYNYSRIGGGDRANSVVDGVATANDRLLASRTGSQWANLDAPLEYSGDSVVYRGASLELTYRYQAVADATIAFGYDSDTNPLNGMHELDSVTLPATSSGSQFDPGMVESYQLDTSSMEAGEYYAYARITSADGHVRYAYSDSYSIVIGEICGTKWQDIDGDGEKDDGEPGLAGRKIYVDDNQNGKWDDGEPFAMTDESGDYTIAPIPVGSHTVAEAAQPGWLQTFPTADSTHTVEVSGTEVVADINFGNIHVFDQVDAMVRFYGTPDDDVFSFVAGQQSVITLNGREYQFDRSVSNIIFDGDSGNDSAHLTGSIGDDEVWLYPNWSRMNGTDFTATVTNVEKILVYTGGGTKDRAHFYDSAGDDRFYARAPKDDAYMKGDGFYNYARNFEQNLAYATAGGADDRAYLYDSMGEDRFHARPAHSFMNGTGFYNDVRGFDSLNVMSVDSLNSDTDRAYFYNSAGDPLSEDAFKAWVAADMVFSIDDDWLDMTGA